MTLLVSLLWNNLLTCCLRQLINRQLFQSLLDRMGTLLALASQLFQGFKFSSYRALLYAVSSFDRQHRAEILTQHSALFIRVKPLEIKLLAFTVLSCSLDRGFRVTICHMHYPFSLSDLLQKLSWILHHSIPRVFFRWMNLWVNTGKMVDAVIYLQPPIITVAGSYNGRNNF